MNPFLANLIVQSTKNFRDKKNYPKGKPSEYKLAKKYHDFIVSLKRNFKNFILIIIGIFSASFGFKGFLLTNDFIDGGATGISLLVAAVTGVPLYILIIAVNLPFVILGYKIMGGQRFAIKTALAIMGLALCVAVVPFPNVTDDDLLVAIFGGFFFRSRYWGYLSVVVL
ncbi:probable membrane protein [Nonlabens ulvanivorans]|uniref:Probable membrane protein n=1 Tax=Nonlabens ulvanivorans TaxID=906888 RepID=A0A090WHT9_NONUL|nr:probable membrane protein [Nonlabens ulvanivorans]